MKKYTIFLLIFCFSLFLFGCGKKQPELSDLQIIKNRGYLIVGTKTDAPPFGYYNKEDKLVGFDIDIAYAIAEYIFGEKSYSNVKFVKVDTQNRIAKLNSKEVDILVATMSVNDKRRLIMNFSAPYFIANQKLLIRKTSKIANLQYFNKNGRLAVVMGSIGERVARNFSPNANLIGVKTYSQAVNLLINNQVDGILGDDCILAGYLTKDLKIINHSYSKEYYAVAVRKSEKSKELLNALNAAVASILDEKRLNFITKKWIMY